MPVYGVLKSRYCAAVPSSPCRPSALPSPRDGGSLRGRPSTDAGFHRLDSRRPFHRLPTQTPALRSDHWQQHAQDTAAVWRLVDGVEFMRRVREGSLSRARRPARPRHRGRRTCGSRHNATAGAPAWGHRRGPPGPPRLAKPLLENEQYADDPEREQEPEVKTAPRTSISDLPRGTLLSGTPRGAGSMSRVETHERNDDAASISLKRVFARLSSLGSPSNRESRRR